MFQPKPVASNDPAVLPCERPQALLDVVVVGDDQQPLADVVLELEEPSSNRVVRTKTDRQGRARFQGLVEAAHRFRLPGVDPALWRVLGARPLKPPTAEAQPAPFGEPPPSTGPLTWTCRGRENAAIIAARLGVRPARLVLASTGATPEPDAALAKGTVLQTEPPAVRWESLRTGQRYVIHRIGLPLSLVLRLRDEAYAPRARRPYLLKVTLEDGAALPHRVGTTDEQGRVVELLPPTALKGELLVDVGGGETETTKLRFAALPPPAEDEGLQPRLENLGFPCGGERGAPGPHTRTALQWFQYASGLPVTGEADAQTRILLFALHQS